MALCMWKPGIECSFPAGTNAIVDEYIRIYPYITSKVLQYLKCSRLENKVDRHESQRFNVCILFNDSLNDIVLTAGEV